MRRCLKSCQLHAISSHAMRNGTNWSSCHKELDIILISSVYNQIPAVKMSTVLLFCNGAARFNLSVSLYFWGLLQWEIYAIDKQQFISEKILGVGHLYMAKHTLYCQKFVDAWPLKFQFLPKVLTGIEVCCLWRPLELIHINVGEYGRLRETLCVQGHGHA